MARHLSDTHVLLWYVTANPKLSSATRSIFENTEDQVFISVASIWEISIKQGIGKLEPLPVDPGEMLSNTGLLKLDISIPHAKLAGQLPLLHRDPFDRMLVAQAQIENLILLTDDWRIEQYDVPTLRP